jgi:hypothetical protein
MIEIKGELRLRERRWFAERLRYRDKRGSDELCSETFEGALQSW